MSTPVVSNEKYVILGATGHTGSIVADVLLSKGQKVRVIGRDKGRLQRFVDKGAEAFTADLSDAAALTKAFTGARAAYLLLPPAKSPEEQERDSDAVAKAVKESGLRYAVHLSSYGAQVAKGAGPVSGLHSSEEKLNAISGLNVLHVRAAYFMENNLAGERHDPSHGNFRKRAVTRLEVTHGRDARCRQLRGAASPQSGFFREANTRGAWRARFVDDGSCRGDCAEHRQTGPPLSAVPVRTGAAGINAIGCSAEGSCYVHRDVQIHQRRSPRSAGTTLAGEHCTDFV